VARCPRAVDEISFSVGEGELVGYIGLNDAGTPTTIKALTGILVSMWLAEPTAHPPAGVSPATAATVARR
jgi:ABC-type hemin transport system ATPase subunit